MDDDGGVDQELSIQQRYYPTITCFGCGPANPKGLQLRSYPAPGLVLARFQPWPEHDNGFGYLNGGIIATLLDCHSGAAVFHESYRVGLAPVEGAVLPFVTAGLDVRYLRPCPLEEELELSAVITSADERAMTVEVELAWDGKPRASATALWKRWRSR